MFADTTKHEKIVPLAPISEAPYSDNKVHKPTPKMSTKVVPRNRQGEPPMAAKTIERTRKQVQLEGTGAPQTRAKFRDDFAAWF